MIFLGFSLNDIFVNRPCGVGTKENPDVSEFIERNFLAVEIGSMDNFTWYIIHI